MDNRVLRFGHCGRNIYTFNDLDPEPDQPASSQVREPPARCPVCHEPVSFGLVDAPVLVLPPFSNGHDATCAFVVACQLGPAFISEQSNTELHVGITNSTGVVFSYTELGVQSQTHGWEQCLTVPLVAPDNCSSSLIATSNNTALQEPPGNTSVSFRKYWDSQLEMFASLNTWTPDSFLVEREFGSCCYGFALGFINHLRRLEGQEPVCPDAFTLRHILPRMAASSKYLSLCQHIRQHGYYSTACTVHSETPPGKSSESTPAEPEPDTGRPVHEAEQLY
ncbi:MKRN2 opposite strand protein-like isoform X2 [Lampris incognitus]|uniref:MKRN2 opposite strand protein-like isoform X2 n=1 Tax=Lampris incognitus TaxID=2546036 RepID=UPI0024B4D0C0|nr:MKRN2 opposite strand protein-like isoform X2 [Lampris incognitus]